jgi:hypothetical protein
LTAENLLSFFKVLSSEEQQKFMRLAAKVIAPAKVTSSKKQKAILSEEEAIQYLNTKHFKRKV